MRRALCLLVLLCAGCASEASTSRCKDVCQRQARCLDEMSEARALPPASGRAADPDEDEDERSKFDTNECIAACTALDRDSEGKKLVEQHVECARKAKDCAALLLCR